MKKIFEKHGEWIRFGILAVLSVAANYGILWLKTNFVCREEFDKHCEQQVAIMSNLVAHVQVSPLINDRQDKAIDRLDGRVQVLENRQGARPLGPPTF